MQDTGLVMYMFPVQDARGILSTVVWNQQPSTAFFDFSFNDSIALSIAWLASSATASAWSSAALPAQSVAPLQPLPAGLTTFSVLPALGFVPLQPLPVDCAPDRVMPPALISPATPRPARSFFMSLLVIGVLL